MTTVAFKTEGLTSHFVAAMAQAGNIDVRGQVLVDVTIKLNEQEVPVLEALRILDAMLAGVVIARSEERALEMIAGEDLKPVLGQIQQAKGSLQKAFRALRDRYNTMPHAERV